MKNKITLDEAWWKCLKQWGKIARDIRNGSTEDVQDLKYRHKSGDNTCMFCAYNLENDFLSCASCPGKLVDITFSCHKKGCHFLNHPLLFHAKLIELNNKRLGWGVVWANTVGREGLVV